MCELTVNQCRESIGNHDLTLRGLGENPLAAPASGQHRFSPGHRGERCCCTVCARPDLGPATAPWMGPGAAEVFRWGFSGVPMDHWIIYDHRGRPISKVSQFGGCLIKSPGFIKSGVDIVNIFMNPNV